MDLSRRVSAISARLAAFQFLGYIGLRNWAAAVGTLARRARVLALGGGSAEGEDEEDADDEWPIAFALMVGAIRTSIEAAGEPQALGRAGSGAPLSRADAAKLLGAITVRWGGEQGRRGSARACRSSWCAPSQRGASAGLEVAGGAALLGSVRLLAVGDGYGPAAGPAGVRRLACEWIRAAGVPRGAERVVLFLHGGAYCFLSTPMYRPMLNRLSRAAGARVFAVRGGPAPCLLYRAHACCVCGRVARARSTTGWHPRTRSPRRLMMRWRRTLG